LLIVLTLLLWLRPAALLHVYEIESHAENFSNWLPKPVQIILTVAAVRLFAQHCRVLDAWVTKYRAQAQATLDALPMVPTAAGFVPLPVRVGGLGNLIAQPGPESLSPYFRSHRRTIQIIGPGGAGKTCLSYQIARWLQDETSSKALLGHPAVVIWLDEDTTDITATLKGHLRSSLGLDMDLPLGLFSALCRKARLALFIDRVSERRTETVCAVQKVYAQTQIKLLIVTSRVKLVFEGSGDVCFFPEHLDSSTLLYFVTALLQGYENLGGFGQLTDQLRLGERFIPMLQTSLLPAGVPVTPLLVRLFVERAIEALRATNSLEGLPRSVPDLYFDYLKRLNPKGAAQSISDEGMLRACQRLAVASIVPGFLPKEIPLPEARTAVDPDGATIQKLVESGVLAQRSAGAESILRFALDPVAEYLAAFALAREAGASEESWERLASSIDNQERAKGFGLALRLTLERYSQDFGWAEAWPEPCLSGSRASPSLARKRSIGIS
jgi:hypothetical protein